MGLFEVAIEQCKKYLYIWLHNQIPFTLHNIRLSLRNQVPFHVVLCYFNAGHLKFTSHLYTSAMTRLAYGMWIRAENCRPTAQKGAAQCRRQKVSCVRQVLEQHCAYALLGCLLEKEVRDIYGYRLSWEPLGRFLEKVWPMQCNLKNPPFLHGKSFRLSYQYVSMPGHLKHKERCLCGPCREELIPSHHIPG